MPMPRIDVNKPFLLIDVDGVLCPYFPDSPLPGYERFDTGQVEVWLSKRHGQWLNDLADWFDLVWATTWEQDAAEILGPVLGLPDDMPVIEFTSPATTGTWKLPDIADFVGQRPFAWIDDDIGPDAVEWAETRSVPSLLVHIDARVGLAETDVGALEQFARSMRPYGGSIGAG